MSKPETKTSSAKSRSTLDARIKQLEAETEWFYSDDFTLDEALTRYKSALKLAQGIEADLAQLKNDIEVIADLAHDN